MYLLAVIFNVPDRSRHIYLQCSGYTSIVCSVCDTVVAEMMNTELWSIYKLVNISLNTAIFIRQ
jgi:hypothetical protein